MNKTLATIFIALSTVLVVYGQEQPGVPAKMTAVNGREFPVFLQGVDGDRIVFQLYKRPTNQNAPMKAIAKIEFVAQVDTAAAEQLFSTGDYTGMILKLKSELKPSVDDYWDFMVVENNLQDVFVMLMKAYLRSGDIASANKAAGILLQNTDPSVQAQAESISLLAALGEGRIEDAEALLAQIESAPGRLYMGASIERAKGNIDAAFQLTNQLIRDFGNDLGWMPQTELLNARLYLESGMTNSAMYTARQVMNIYKNSDVGNDAAQLHSELVLELKKHEDKRKAREDAEEAARAAVRARAAERAKGYGFGDEEESEVEDAVEGDAEVDVPDTDVEGSQDSGEL